MQGSPGEYYIHKRNPNDDSNKRNVCLHKSNCKDEKNRKLIENGKTELTIDVKLGKCSNRNCAGYWNILGDTDTGYLLSTNDNLFCLNRQGINAKLVPCANTNQDLLPTKLHLNFATKEDITLMSSEGSQLIAASSSGEKALVNKYVKTLNVDVNSRDWDNMTPLIAAASNGHLNIVKILIGNQADYNLVDKDGIDCLMEAVIMGHLPVVKYLVENTEPVIDVNKLSNSNVNSVWLAAGEGHLEILKYLLKHGGNPNILRSDGISPLHTASVSGRTDIINLLLTSELIIPPMDVNVKDSEGLTPLMNACENGTIPIIKQLLSFNADVNTLSNNGFTALIVASASGFVDTVDVLLNSGATVDLMHTSGVTALMYAASSGHLKVVEKLVNEGKADIELRHANGGTALMEASTANTEDNLNVIRFLIEKGASHDVKDNDSVTPLMSASSQAACDIVQLLIDTEKKKPGSNEDTMKEYVNFAAASGGTALMFAAGSGAVQCIQALLDASADVNTGVEASPAYLEEIAAAIAAGNTIEPHTDGVTSLQIAASAGHYDVVKLLIDAKADVNARDDEEKNALMSAVKGNFGEVASLLVEFGADANEPYIDEEGNAHNLLMDAIIVENGNFSKLLIENQADLTYTDDHKVTTLIQASHRGLFDIVSLLLKFGAGGKIDVDAANDEGITAVIAASSEGFFDCVKVLVDVGKVNINAVDKDGTNALMAAAVRGHKEIVEFLVSKNVEVNAQNIDGHTALMFAYNGLNQVATLWQKYETYMSESEEVTEDEGANSKIIAEALANHTDVVNILIKGGSDENLKDKEGHVAKDFDFHPEVTEEELDKEIKVEKRRKKGKNEL